MTKSIIVIANAEDHARAAQAAGATIATSLTDAVGRGWCVWYDSRRNDGGIRKRRYAAGKIRKSSFLGCSIPGAYSHHATIEAAIARAKSESKKEQE